MSVHPRIAPPRAASRSRTVVAACIAALALVASACGSAPSAASASTPGSGGTSTASGSATTTQTAAQQKGPQAFSACMRSHGIPNFPDLTNGRMMIKATNNQVTVNGVALNVKGTLFMSAQKACQSKLQAHKPTAAMRAQAKKRALAFAACMRSHGVSNFPDPTFTNGAIGITINKAVAQSPAFKSAQQACQSLMKPPTGGQ